MAAGLLIWCGCTYREKLPQELSCFLRLLEKLDVNFSLLEEEGCCGFPLILSGCWSEARSRAGEVVDRLKGYSTVVAPCPACFRMFREFYPKLGFKPPEVLHSTQFLHALLQNGVLSTDRLKQVRMKVMYHDPCELGRHSGVYEEPRELLSAVPGVTFYEPRFTRERAACCGGGGLLPLYFPTLSVMVASRKLLKEDEIPSDLDAIVTSCPQCILNLRRGVEWIGNEKPLNVKVLSVSQLLERALR